jgi:hypothetical protein
MNADVQIPSKTGPQRRTSWRYWIEPGCLASIYLANELLPVVCGIGEHARLDWAFLYVTLRAMVLPLGAIALVVLNVVRVVRGQRRSSLSLVLQAIPCAAIVTLCWIYQGALFIHKP